MKVLIVSSTQAEISPLFEYHQLHSGARDIEFLFTGVGMVNLSITLTRKLSLNHYDLVILAGICGSFHEKYQPGALIEITREAYGDLGAEDKDGSFLSLPDLGLLDPNAFPFENNWIVNTNQSALTEGLPKVSSVTVNTTSGTQQTIDRITSIFHPDTESMEGAAFFQVCKSFDIPFIQIRSISNMVEPRNRESWKIKEAVLALNSFLIEKLYP
jgi:futalosine hydrolase